MGHYVLTKKNFIKRKRLKNRVEGARGQKNLKIQYNSNVINDH